MKRAFRLETVLRYRRQMEEVVRQEFLEARRDLEAEERHLMGLETLKHRTRKALSRLRNQAVDPEAFALHQQHFQWVEEAVQEQRRRVMEKIRAFQERRARLLEATRERKVLEQLQQRHQSQWWIWWRRRERRMLDEVLRGRQSGGEGENRDR